MSAVVRRATATHNSASSSDLTQRRTTRNTANATATTSAITLDAPEPDTTDTKRRSTLVKVVSDTFYGLKNKAVDQVSRAFRANQKKASLPSSTISITTGISTRSAVRTAAQREASSEKESSPISTSVVSANLQLVETSQSPPSAAPVATVFGSTAIVSKTFLSEGLFSNVVSHPKAKYNRTSKTSRAIRAGKATAIEQASVAAGSTEVNRILPLPLHWGLRKMEERSEFLVPWDIMSEWQSGELDSQKSPTKYVKLRKNIFPERKARVSTEWQALCHCEPESGCGENCLNRAMNYLCGKNCPCGDKCTNGSLSLRPQKETKIFWTGARGFGVQAAESIKEGEFVMDYRGEIIPMTTFYKRIRNEYNNRKDFYALSYDADEVIDAGLRGNEARFINHSCGPNLEVRKYQTMGNGSEEFEVGFWALRDIRAGEELSYNYNFDSFTTIKRPSTHPELVEATLQRRQRCLCGAPNCVGWLGKESAESSKTNPDENIAPELRGPALAGDDATVSAPKKILLKLGGTSQSARGVKRQASAAAGSEGLISPNKRATASVTSKGKGKVKTKASQSASPEAVEPQHDAEVAAGTDMVHPAEEIPEEYLSAEKSTGEIPVSSNLSSLLHHDGEGFAEEHYAVTGEFPASEAYTETVAYQDGISFTEANPAEYAQEAGSQLEFNQPKVSNKGKGVRVIEKHRRKTKYGLIWKSDAELELERR